MLRDADQCNDFTSGILCALVPVDHQDIVKVEDVSALRGVCLHLICSFVPADGPFVLLHKGPQTFASFLDILNPTLAAFKAVDII